MRAIREVAEIGALLGDRARAAILGALLGGRSRTAKELAKAAGVSCQTTSWHLAGLSRAGLIRFRRRGRHRHYRLGSPLVGRLVRVAVALAVRARARASAPRDATTRERPVGLTRASRGP
jgi:DNA-binding transcriptional ArsR family regulator